MSGKTGWIDVSISIRDSMAHWPGDPAVTVERVADVARGDSHTLSRLTLGSHTGTHVDAPAHFISGGDSIDEMPFDATVGPARVIEINNPEAVTAAELAGAGIVADERILLKTANSRKNIWRRGEFVTDFVHIEKEAAAYLVSRRVRLIGVDYLSVGGYQRDGAAVHELLLENGIWIIEGLDLAPVTPGHYEFVCLPLRLAGGDGAPARAIVRKL